jgi:hypothetical protein
MRTTINISDAILSELRAEAAQSHRPFRRVLEETLQRGMTSPQKQRGTLKIKTFPVGIKAAYHGMSLNQLYDQMESEGSVKKGMRR